MNFYVFRRVFFSCLSLSQNASFLLVYLRCVPYDLCAFYLSLFPITGRLDWKEAMVDMYLDHYRCLSAMVMCTLTITVAYRPWSYVPRPLPLSTSHG